MSEKYTEEQIKTLGRAFVKELVEFFTPEQLAEVKRLNATVEYTTGGQCATHEFCDANEFMSDAWLKVFGKDFIDDTLDDVPEADLDCWNDAWTWAKNVMLTDKEEVK